MLTGEWDELGQLGEVLGLDRREDLLGNGGWRENEAWEECGDTDIDSEDRDLGRNCNLTENIETQIPEKVEENQAINGYNIDIKNSSEDQSPKFHIEKSQSQVEATPRDIKFNLDLKLKAKKLLFKLENSGLTLPEQGRRRRLAAAEAVLTGQVATVKMAADYFNVNKNSLTQGLKRGSFKKKQGRVKKAFTDEEEKKLVSYIKSLDFEVTRRQISTAVQEALLDITKNNPERKTGMEDTGQMPGYSWVRRFVERNGIKTLNPNPPCVPWQEMDLEKFAKWQRINYGC